MLMEILKKLKRILRRHIILEKETTYVENLDNFIVNVK